MCIPTNLILVQFAIFVLLFALILKGDNNETNEYVNHEKGDDDDIDNVISGNNWAKIVNWSMIFAIGVDRDVE